MLGRRLPGRPCSPRLGGVRWRAGALASLAFLLAACGGGEEAEPPGPATTVAAPPTVEGPPPTPAQLIGTWTRIGTAGLIQFTEDGEFRIARSTTELVDLPFAVGTYRLDGASIELSGGCRSVWTTGLADDELHAVVVEEGCALPRGAVLQFARISP